LGMTLSDPTNKTTSCRQHALLPAAITRERTPSGDERGCGDDDRPLDRGAREPVGSTRHRTAPPSVRQVRAHPGRRARRVPSEGQRVPAHQPSWCTSLRRTQTCCAEHGHPTGRGPCRGRADNAPARRDRPRASCASPCARPRRPRRARRPGTAPAGLRSPSSGGRASQAACDMSEAQKSCGAVYPKRHGSNSPIQQRVPILGAINGPFHAVACAGLSSVRGAEVVSLCA